MNLNEFECILMHFISVSDCICILMYTYVFILLSCFIVTATA